MHSNLRSIYPAALALGELTRGHSEARLEEVYFLNATRDISLPVREIANPVFRDFITARPHSDSPFDFCVACNFIPYIQDLIKIKLPRSLNATYVLL